MFLEISQNLQENICARVSFLINFQTPGLQWSWQSLSVNTYETLCIIKNFTSSMIECTVILRLPYVCDDINNFCFSNFVYAPGLSSIDLNQFSKYVKNWCFIHENRGSSVEENGALNGFNSCGDAGVLLTFMISKNSTLNKIWLFQLHLLVLN